MDHLSLAAFEWVFVGRERWSCVNVGKPSDRNGVKRN